MTREEAHRILSNGLVNAPSEHEWCMAFEMAIKALEQEPTVAIVDILMHDVEDEIETILYDDCEEYKAESEVEE